MAAAAVYTVRRRGGPHSADNVPPSVRMLYRQTLYLKPPPATGRIRNSDGGAV